MQAFHLEEIVKPRKVACFKNLIIKEDSLSSDLVSATYSDISVAYSNPKELHFEEAVKRLDSQIEVAYQKLKLKPFSCQGGNPIPIFLLDSLLKS